MIRLRDDWLTRSATQAVLSLLTDAGHQVYVVGGCVRNALLGFAVHDVDLATDAHPETVMALAEAAGMKAVPTGIAHGTVTLVVDGIGYEITTFRADVDTDGRHATVRFSEHLAEDARRRDFTMNALYADRNGQVIDPLNGLSDLRARRIRFVGDPSRRITEDYLRILRFFRFSAWYAAPGSGFDPDALSAIAEHLDGLDSLSRERIGAEMIKLLSSPDPAPAVSSMQAVGVLTRCLPGADARPLAPLVHLEAETGLAPDSLRRLAAMGIRDGSLLRLSRADQKRLQQYRSLIGEMHGAAALGYLFGQDTARDVLVLRAVLLEQPLDPDVFKDVNAGASAVFPIAARDLMPRFTGAALGERLDLLEQRWIASNFTLTRDDLLS